MPGQGPGAAPQCELLQRPHPHERSCPGSERQENLDTPTAYCADLAPLAGRQPLAEDRAARLYLCEPHPTTQNRQEQTSTTWCWPSE
eukprot:3393843-Pyramimonas_sp.AAC.1